MPPHTNYKFFRQSGNGLLGVRWDPDITILITHVKLHLTDVTDSASVSATGSFVGATTDFTIQVDSDFGAAFDVVLKTEDMSSATDLLWIPEQPVPLQRTDNVLFSLATAELWGLEVCYREEV